MDQLLDQFSVPQPAGEGEIFDGRVLAVTDAGVVVDVGGKFEGLVPAQEFSIRAIPLNSAPGKQLKLSGYTSAKTDTCCFLTRAPTGGACGSASRSPIGSTPT